MKSEKKLEVDLESEGSKIIYEPYFLRSFI